jgi:ABC-type polysaccharide/polyol phosphate transport system ATPase subunit
MLCGITQPTRGFFDVRGRIAPILALGSAFDGLLTGQENARIAGTAKDISDALPVSAWRRLSAGAGAIPDHRS